MFHDRMTEVTPPFSVRLLWSQFNEETYPTLTGNPDKTLRIIKCFYFGQRRLHLNLTRTVKLLKIGRTDLAQGTPLSLTGGRQYHVYLMPTRKCASVSLPIHKGSQWPSRTTNHRRQYGSEQ